MAGWVGADRTIRGQSGTMRITALSSLDTESEEIMLPPLSDVAHLQLAVERQLGIRRAAQTLIYGGRLLRSDALLTDVLQDGAVIFVKVDTSAFPERLEPFRVLPAPLTGADFTIPQWGGKVRSTEGGMYMMSREAVERHGVLPHNSVRFPLVGQLSAIQVVTVPDAEKGSLSIPLAAKWFAWSYPCSDHVNLAPADETDASAMHATLFLNTGGFVYFDEARNILASNTGTFGEIAPSSSRSSSEPDGALHFGAPLRWQPEWTEALMRQGGGQWGRFHRITLSALRGTGARYFAWLPPQLPGEPMRGSDGQPLASQPEQRHGAFAYLFHEDTSVDDPRSLVFPLVSSGRGHNHIGRTNSMAAY